jgi:hypothetical protein
MNAPVLTVQGLVKRFGGLVATDNVTLDVRPGEIHALIGAAAYIVLESVLASWTEYWQLGLGFILLFVVLYTNGGIEALFGRLLGRRA